MFKKLRKTIAICLMAITLCSNIIPVMAQYKDVSGHWASSEVDKWVSKNLIEGYPDGTFRPDDPVSRAEFVSILNKVLNLIERSTTKMADVPGDAWYHTVISKAAAAGLLQGDDTGAFRPDHKLSRQEAAVILCRAFDLKPRDKSAAGRFSDVDIIASWGKDSVSALVENGYVQGRGNNLFAPSDRVTRAEAIKMIGNIMGEIKNTSGTYSNDVATNLIVNTRNVTLKNMTINGNLYITQGVGDGEVLLENVTVKGITVIRGGGETGITLNNSKLDGTLDVLKKDGIIKVLAKGSTEVSGIKLNSGALLKTSNQNGKGFVNIEVSELVSSNHSIKLYTDTENITVNAPNSNLEVLGGKVSKINVLKDATGTNIKVSGATIDTMDIQAKSSIDVVSGNVLKLDIQANGVGSDINLQGEASVDTFTTYASVVVNGAGRITTANINADNVTLNGNPTAVNYKSGVTASANSTTPTPSVTPTPTLVPTPTPIPMYTSTASTSSVISMDAADKTMTIGTTITSHVWTYPYNCTLRFTSSNPDIAEVDQTSGVIDGKRSGTVTITVNASKAGYISNSTTFTVKVYEGSITINAPDVTLRLGDTFNLASLVHVSPSDSQVIYTTSNSNIVEINMTNKTVLAKNVGTVTMNVTARKYGYADQSASFKINVNNSQQTTAGSVVVNPKEVTKDTTRTIRVTYTPGERQVNETVSFTLPEGFEATADIDKVSISSGASIRVVEKSEISADERTVTISNLNFKDNIPNIELILYDKVIPPFSNRTYEFKIKEDADGSGTAMDYSVEKIRTILGVDTITDFMEDFSYKINLDTTKKLKWTPAVGASDIKIQHSKDNGNTWVDSTIQGSILPNASEAIIIGLEQNSWYLFRLKVDGGENSGYSNIVNSKYTLCSQPVLQDSFAQPGSTIELDFPPPVPATAFLAPENTTWISHPLPPNVTELYGNGYSKTMPVPTVPGRYKLFIYNPGGLSLPSTGTLTVMPLPDKPALSGTAVAPGATVTLTSAPPTGTVAWLAPEATTDFNVAPGPTMTKLIGDGTTKVIAAPTVPGEYKLFFVNAVGPSIPSDGTLTVKASPASALMANSTTINITMDGALINSNGDPSAFTVHIGAATGVVTQVNVYGTTVTITLDAVGTIVNPGDVVKVDYSATGTNDLSNGALVDNFTNFNVTNNL